MQSNGAAEGIDQKRNASTEFSPTRTSMHSRPAFSKERHRGLKVLNFPDHRCAADATRTLVIGRMKPDHNAWSAHEGK